MTVEFSTKVNIYLYFLENKTRQTVCKDLGKGGPSIRAELQTQEHEICMFSQPLILMYMALLTKAR